MKIGNPLDLVRASQPGCDGDATAEKHGSTAPSGPADTGSPLIKISGGRANVSAEMNGGNPFSAKRVAQFKTAIADGSFKVNAKAVANKLVAGNLEALSRSKP